MSNISPGDIFECVSVYICFTILQGDTFLISTWHHGELLMYRDDVASVLASDLGSQPLFGLAYNSPNLQSVSGITQ